jgi:hypothetical protein
MNDRLEQKRQDEGTGKRKVYESLPKGVHGFRIFGIFLLTNRL